MAMRFRSICSNAPFDGLVLPVHDHGLGAFATIESQIENRVVAGLGMQNARDLARIEADRHELLAGAVNARPGILPLTAHAAGVVLVAATPRLRFQYSCFRLLLP